MANTTFYEWVVEHIDPEADGDILECSYWSEAELGNALAQVRDWRDVGRVVDFGLCRRVGNEWEGDVDRQYLYHTPSGWPDAFEGGAAIPQRLKRVLPRLDT
jgi:hypothetical protein